MIGIHTGKHAVLSAILLGVLFLLFPTGIRTAAFRSLRLCAEKLIPALFPFLVLTALYRKASPFPSRRPLLAVPLIGMIAGAPVGAELTGNCFRSGAIGKKTASTLLFLSDTLSPAFLVLAVGEGMLGDRGLGWRLFFAQGIAALLIGGVFFLNGREKPDAGQPVPALPAAGEFRLLPAVSSSVSEGAFSMLRIVGAVVFFGAVSGLPLPSGKASVILAALTEVTGGCAACASLGGEAGLLFTAAAVGFSGLSVAAQVGFSADGIPMGRYFLGKCLSALLTPMIFAIFLHFPR